MYTDRKQRYMNQDCDRDLKYDLNLHVCWVEKPRKIILNSDMLKILNLDSVLANTLNLTKPILLY